MPLTLDSRTEQRIQQEAEARHYATPAELINVALDLLAEKEDHFAADRVEIRALLEERWQEAEKGAWVSSEELEQMLRDRRGGRSL